MFIGQQHAGKTFVDYLNFVTELVTIGEDGNAEFKVNGRSVSVWGIQSAS